MEDEPPEADLPKCKRRWFQFSLRTLLIGVTLLCVWLGMIRFAHFSMNAADVAGMTVTSLDSPAKIVEIPDAQIPFVIETLVAAKAVWNPAKWETFGFMRCRMKSGKTIEIDLFYVDDRELALRTDQEHYFRGADAKRFFAIVEKARQAASSGH